MFITGVIQDYRRPLTGRQQGKIQMIGSVIQYQQRVMLMVIDLVM